MISPASRAVAQPARTKLQDREDGNTYATNAKALGTSFKPHPERRLPYELRDHSRLEHTVDGFKWRGFRKDANSVKTRIEFLLN
jgi:hypothetical protein